MKTPETLKLTPEQTDSLFTEVRSSNLSEEHKEWIILGIQSLFWIGTAYQDKKHKLFRFINKIFGPKTEQVRPKKGQGGQQKNKEEQSNPGLSENANPNADPFQSESANDLNQGIADDPSNEKPKPKGHGRRSADAFKKATFVQIALDTLKAGDKCPKCPKGTLYKYPPGKILVLMGQAPISAIHLKLQSFHCGTCGAIFKATIPKIFATHQEELRKQKQ
jgi:transposase